VGVVGVGGVGSGALVAESVWMVEGRGRQVVEGWVETGREDSDGHQELCR